MSRIILDHITKRFGNTVAVDDLCLEIESGSFFSLLGPSGCGKTTTMRLIAGLETADEGRIWIGDRLVFDGKDRTFVPPGKRGIGMVFQNYALWPHMTVRENILFGLKVRRVTSAEQQQRLSRVLERLQVTELADRYPSELSGGQQQRIALARELVTGAGVLLMDEPLSNLDAKLRIDMRVELKQLHEETGGTIIYVTHDQIEALTLSTRMAVMKYGVMQQTDVPSYVFAQPANLFVAQFMGHTPINLITATLAGSQLRFGDVGLPRPASLQALPDNETVLVAARPEELELVAAPGPWSVPARIESVLPMGYDSLLRVRVASDVNAAADSQIHLTVAADERTRSVGEGDSCHVAFDQKAVHYFDKDSGARIG
ncbi:MAG: ABC transporter ATP-binding protein [Spirochaetaceae bacterium]|nr:MAG: ABC transporter ATP-binding protein [Spirochaetaceae bacterium]